MIYFLNSFVSFCKGNDEGLSSWPSMDGPSITALSSHTRPRLPASGAIARKGRATKSIMGPPKSLPARGRATSKKATFATFVNSSVQAKSHGLSKGTVLLVKNCTAAHRGTPVTMRLSGGSGLRYEKPKNLLSLAKAFKAPFHDAPVDSVDLVEDQPHGSWVGMAAVFVGPSSSAICTPQEHQKAIPRGSPHCPSPIKTVQV